MMIKRKLNPDFREGIDRKDLTILCRRFLSLAKVRLQRTRMAMTARQQIVLDVLPLLFHVNHPLLPGYVSRQTPHIVRHFAPGKEVLRQAQRLSRSFRYREVDNKHGDIISIFLMGSTGSVAHSVSSDLDIWLCYRNGLSRKLLNELASKAEQVSEWAAEMGAEVHIFLMNAADFRQGRATAAADSEDCGTAQQYLLLDEFYRTGIWLAGAYPLWWLIPANQEINYQQIARTLLEKRFIRSRDYIDFGGCSAIPANEFVGAGMWQLYKGIDSPFKSVLKLVLIESYARDDHEASPLCLDFKQAVYDDDLDSEELDPYVMIYRRLERSLGNRGQKRKLDLVRRSFYLKVGEKLSHKLHGKEQSWRRELMAKLAREWLFDDRLLKYLDSRSLWRIDEVTKERRSIVNELTDSYRFLSGYARSKGLAAAISVRDINLLGRKLYATFQRKAGKVEVVNPGIAPSLAEDSLSFHHLSGLALASSADAWLLYRNLTTPSEADFSPALKRSNSLLELILWSHVNGLLASTTSVSLAAGKSAASLFEVQHIIANLKSQIAMPMPPVTQQAYQYRVQLRKILLFVNVAIDPMTDMTRRGLHMLSDHTDALGYASSRSNLVISLDKVLVNSWNEVMVQHYEAGVPLVQCLNNTLAALAEAEQFAPELPAFAVYCFCPNRADAIAKRVYDLFSEVLDCFFGPQSRASALHQKRYLLQMEERFFVIQFEGKRPRFLVFENYSELCDYLELPQPHYSAIHVDAYALPNDPLMFVFRNMRSRVVQVYIQPLKSNNELVLVDECGSVIRRFFEADSPRVFLGALCLFLDSIRERKQMRETLDASQTGILEIEFYRLKRDLAADNSYQQENLTVHSQQGFGDYIELQAIGEMDQSGDLSFTLFCEHQEFSPVDHSARVSEALAHYLNRRFGPVDSLPCFITDLSLPHSLFEDAAQIPTSLYLSYKFQLEAKLAEARYQQHQMSGPGNLIG